VRAARRAAFEARLSRNMDGGRVDKRGHQKNPPRIFRCGAECRSPGYFFALKSKSALESALLELLRLGADLRPWVAAAPGFFFRLPGLEIGLNSASPLSVRLHVARGRVRLHETRRTCLRARPIVGGEPRASSRPFSSAAGRAGAASQVAERRARPPSTSDGMADFAASGNLVKKASTNSESLR